MHLWWCTAPLPRTASIAGPRPPTRDRSAHDGAVTDPPLPEWITDVSIDGRPHQLVIAVAGAAGVRNRLVRDAAARATRVYASGRPDTGGHGITVVWSNVATWELTAVQRHRP